MSYNFLLTTNKKPIAFSIVHNQRGWPSSFDQSKNYIKKLISGWIRNDPRLTSVYRVKYGLLARPVRAPRRFRCTVGSFDSIDSFNTYHFGANVGANVWLGPKPWLTEKIHLQSCNQAPIGWQRCLPSFLILVEQINRTTNTITPNKQNKDNDDEGILSSRGILVCRTCTRIRCYQAPAPAEVFFFGVQQKRQRQSLFDECQDHSSVRRCRGIPLFQYPSGGTRLCCRWFFCGQQHGTFGRSQWR